MPRKQFLEREFWKNQKDVYTDWFMGNRWLYGRPPPEEQHKVKGSSSWDSVIRTVFKYGTSMRHDYARRLHLPPDYFSNKVVVDVGSGPLGGACAFTDCTVIGVEPLADIYRGLRYPIDTYSERMTCLCCPAEAIDLPGRYADAVIAVNALDHVDDFHATAREMMRILKPGGMIRVEAHYHEPTFCEPQRLNDALMEQAFGEVGLRKIHSQPPGGEFTSDEEVALFSNVDYLYSWPTKQ